MSTGDTSDCGRGANSTRVCNCSLPAQLDKSIRTKTVQSMARQHKEQGGLASACDSDDSPLLVLTTSMLLLQQVGLLSYCSRVGNPFEGISTTKYQHRHAGLLLLPLLLLCCALGENHILFSTWCFVDLLPSVPRVVYEY